MKHSKKENIQSKEVKNLNNSQVKKQKDLKSQDVSKLIGSIKSNEVKTPVLKPKKSKRAKVAIISSATVAVGGAGIGAAVYVANQNKDYVITMYYEDGEPTEVKVNKVSELKVPEVPGYKFAGWYKDPSYTVPFKSTARFEEDCSVYGKYIPIEYEVVFENQGHVYGSVLKVNFDSSFIFPIIDIENPDENKTGYTFAGWALNPDETNPDKIYSPEDENEKEMVMNVVGGMKFYAIWNINTYTVSVDFTGLLDINKQPIENITENRTYKANIQDLLLWDVKYENYSKKFVGYYYEYNGEVVEIKINSPHNLPAENIEIKPLYENVTVKLVLDYNDGVTDNTEVDLTYNTNTQSYNLSEPIRVGYLFKGWSRKRTWDINSESAQYIGETFTLDENKDSSRVVLYAIWAHQYKILAADEEFDANKIDEEGYVKKVFTFASSFEFEAATKENYTFKCFKLLNKDGEPTGEEIESPYEIKEDTYKFNGVVVLKPEFVANSKTLVFDLNNDNIYDKENNKIYLDTENITDFSEVLDYSESGKKSYTFPTLKMKDDDQNENYTFKGWSRNPGATVGDEVSYILPDTTTLENENITFYAIWEAKIIDKQIILDNPETSDNESTFGSIKINSQSVTSVSAPYGSKIEISKGIINGKIDIKVNNNIYTTILVEPNNSDYKYSYSIDKISSTENNLTNNTVLKVYFKREYRSYNVSLNLNGANINKQEDGFLTLYENVSCDPSETTTINTPDREHYIFKGWSTENDGTIDKDKDYEYKGIDIIFTMPQEDWGRTLYAIWELNSYEFSMSFNREGDEVDGLKLPYITGKDEGDAYTATFPANTKLTYTLANSSEVSDGYETYATLTAEGYGTLNIYHARKINSKQAYIIKSVKYKNGESWVEIPNNAKLELTGALEIQINYQVETNEITFKYVNVKDGIYHNNPKMDGTLSDITFEATNTFTVENATNTNYTLSGWAYGKSDGSYLYNDKTAIFKVGAEFVYDYEDIKPKLSSYLDDTIYLVPVWKGVDHVVTISQEGKDINENTHNYQGEIIALTIEYGKTYPLPDELECVDEGFYLSGYMIGGKTYNTGDSITVEDDITIEPIWGNEIGITFNVNNDYVTGAESAIVYLIPEEDGSATTSIDTHLGTNFKLTDTSGKFTFLGWSTQAHEYVENESEADGWIVNTATDETYTTSTTYYAVWQVKKFNVSVGFSNPQYNKTFSQPILGLTNIEWNLYDELADFYTVGEPYIIVNAGDDLVNPVFGGISLYPQSTYNEIEKVEYRVNGGAWTELAESTPISVTGNIEFMFTLKNVEEQYSIEYKEDTTSEIAQNYAPTMSFVGEKPTTVGGLDKLTLPTVTDSKGTSQFLGWYDNYGNFIDKDALSGIDFNTWKNYVLSDSNYAGTTKKLQFTPKWELNSYEKTFNIEQYKQTLDGKKISAEIVKVKYNGELVEAGDTITIEHGTTYHNIVNGIELSNGDTITYELITPDDSTNETSVEISFDGTGSEQVSIKVNKVYKNTTITFAETNYGWNLKNISGNDDPIEQSYLNHPDCYTALPHLTDLDGNYTFIGWSPVDTYSENFQFDCYSDGSIIFNEYFEGTVYPVWQGRTITVTFEKGEGFEYVDDLEFSEGFSFEYGDTVYGWVEANGDSNVFGTIQVEPMINPMGSNSHDATVITGTSKRNCLWNLSGDIDIASITEDTTITIDLEWSASEVEVKFEGVDESYILNENNKSLTVPKYDVIDIPHKHVTSWEYDLIPDATFNPYEMTNEELEVYGIHNYNTTLTVGANVAWNEYTIIVPTSYVFEIEEKENVKFTYSEGGKFDGFTVHLNDRYSYSIAEMWVGSLDNMDSVTVVSNNFAFNYSDLPDTMKHGDYISFEIHDIQEDIRLFVDFSLDVDEKKFGDMVGGVYSYEEWSYISDTQSSGFATLYLDDMPTRENYTLLGFSTKEDASSLDYEFGEEYEGSGYRTREIYFESDLTLYPVWQGNARVLLHVLLEEDPDNKWFYNAGLSDFCRQGDTITLPSAEKVAEINALYYYTEITGFRVRMGEVSKDYTPGASFEVNLDESVDIHVHIEPLFKYKYATVEIDLNGGTSDNVLSEQFIVGWWWNAQSYAVTPPQNTKYLSYYEVWVDGQKHFDVDRDIGFTLDLEANYVLIAQYEEKDIYYNFTSNVSGATLPTNSNGYGFELSGNDIILNFNEDQFILDGYKLSHFEFVRNGVTETAVLGGSFKDVTTLVPISNDRSYAFDIKVVFVKDDQLLTFHTATTPDELECEIGTVLPSEYQQVEYIEGTGTQYINTGVNATNDIEIISEFASTDITQNRCYVFGVYGNSNQRIQFSYSDPAFIGWWDQYTNSISYFEVDTNKHIIKVSKGEFILDDKNINTMKDGYFASYTPIYMFALNANETISNVSKIKLYNTEIYKEGTLIRKYIPCYRKSDNVAGLYDLVNNIFYTNSGTGSFISGDEYSLAGTKIQVEKSEITKTNMSVYSGAKFTIPSAVEKEKTENGVTKYFVGWSTDSDASTVEYYPGDTWTYDSTTTLDFYPVYEAADETLLTFTNNGDGTCTVSGLTDEGKTKTRIIIPSTYNGMTVTAIGNSSFMGNTTLKSVVIPASITTIEANAFSDCTNLTSVTFAEGSQLTSIGGKAFHYCDNLQSIVIPAGVTSIGNETFRYCKSLTSVTFAEGSQLTSIGGYAFYNCNSLQSIVIPEGVTSIGSYAFYYCSSLKVVVNLSDLNIVAGETTYGYVAYYAEIVTTDADIIFVEENDVKYYVTADERIAIEATDKTKTTYALHEGTTKISSNAFYNCTSLQSIVIPAGVTSIGNDAFYSCGALTSVTFAEGSQLTSIENSAFYSCTSLQSIVIPAGVTSIENSAFYSCTSLQTIVIPEGVTSIGSYAFYSCRNLESIEIPASVTSIGYSAFYSCGALTSVTFAEGSQLTSIGSYAFYNCTSLQSIDIPDSVTSIGAKAFYGTKITTLTINTTGWKYSTDNKNWTDITETDIGVFMLANLEYYYTRN